MQSTDQGSWFHWGRRSTAALCGTRYNCHRKRSTRVHKQKVKSGWLLTRILLKERIVLRIASVESYWYFLQVAVQLKSVGSFSGQAESRALARSKYHTHYLLLYLQLIVLLLFVCLRSVSVCRRRMRSCQLTFTERPEVQSNRPPCCLCRRSVCRQSAACRSRRSTVPCAALYTAITTHCQVLCRWCLSPLSCTAVRTCSARYARLVF